MFLDNTYPTTSDRITDLMMGMGEMFREIEKSNRAILIDLECTIPIQNDVHFNSFMWIDPESYNKRLQAVGIVTRNRFAVNRINAYVTQKDLTNILRKCLHPT